MIFFLLLLIFISKVSLAFLGFFPNEVGPVIYQWGMHPYVNMAFNFIVGGFLFLTWFWKGLHVYTQSRFFRFLLFLVSLFLIFITLLQCFFVNPEESFIFQMAAAIMAVFTIYLYGRVIPTSMKPETFLIAIKNLTLFFCFLSLIVLIVSPGTSFKGSRFIGIFKHIPHMVSCATIACFAIYYSLFHEKLSRTKLLLNYFYLLISFGLLILTGTRSALAAVCIGFVMCLFIFKAKSAENLFLKTALAICTLIVMTFFGYDIADFGFRVIRGEQAIAQRAAQDGLKSRLEEVERGFAIFSKDQWLGQGLLMKFSNGQEAEVSGYNANKDPHNLFVSAGVIGGWGFVFITLLGFFGLIFMSANALFSKNEAMKILAVYIITHIPILFIYHMHLSLGGIADRIYWIVIGYMAVKEIDLKKETQA